MILVQLKIVAGSWSSGLYATFYENEKIGFDGV